MPRRIDLLVPHWKETADEMAPLLDSLALQQGVDLSQAGVIVAHDGPEACALPVDEWGDRYPFAVEEVRLPQKVGVSAARNAALDASGADLVCFCDADDMLCSALGLSVVLGEWERSRFQTMVSEFVEQTKAPDGSLVFVPHRNDSTFVHGKVHDRAWLAREGLRFEPSLTVHEDSYFNVLAREVADPRRAVYCPMPWYLWRWRDASVCRHDPDYILKTYDRMLDSSDALVRELARRGMPERAAVYCATMVWDAYYAMNRPEWTDTGNAAYRGRVERRFSEYFAAHRARWDGMDERERMAISSAVRARSVGDGMHAEEVTLGQWLRSVAGGCGE